MIKQNRSNQFIEFPGTGIVIPPSGYVVPADRINPIDIQDNSMYQGILVKLLLEDERRFVAARSELASINTETEKCMDRTTHVAAVLGTGVTLRVYLQSQQAHQTLVALLHKMKDAIDEQAKQGIRVIDPSHMLLAEANTLTEKLASLVLKVQNNKDDGTELQKWIEQNGPQSAKQAYAMLKAHIDQGGARRKPELDALYRLAVGVYAKFKNHKAKWPLIVDTIWSSVKQAEQRTSDQQMVYELWKEKNYNARREQLRTLWKPFSGKENL